MESSRESGDGQQNGASSEVHPPEESMSTRAPRLQGSNRMNIDDDILMKAEEEDEGEHNGRAALNLSFGGSRAIEYDFLTIEPNTSIRGSPRGSRRSNNCEGEEEIGKSILAPENSDKLFQGNEEEEHNSERSKSHHGTDRSKNDDDHKPLLGGDDSSSGYSDIVEVDGYQPPANDYGSNKSSFQQENVIFTNASDEPITIGGSLTMEGSNSKKKRSNVDSRDKRYSSFSEFSSASSYLNDISVSTLNPSDFSENYSPNKAPQNSTQSKRNQPVKQVYTPNVNKSRRSNGTPNRQNSSRRSTASKSNSTVNYLQVMPPLPSQQKTAKKPLYTPPVHEEVPEPTEEQLKLMERAMQGEEILDLQPEEYDDLIIQMQQARKQRASDHKYKDGQKLNNALTLVKNCQLKVMKEKRQKEAEQEFNEKYEKFLADFQAFDDETSQLKEDLNQRIEEQRQAMVDNHAQQKKELEEHWTTPNKMRMYNRASNSLGVLKKKHKLLLTQARFNEAEAIDQIIKQRLKEEEVINHEHHQADFDMALGLLQAKQKDEMVFFEENAKVQVQKLTQSRARLRVGWENQKKRYEARQQLVKDSDKLWNSEQFQRRDLANTKMMMRPTQPLGRITAKDIPDLDLPILELPPLNFRDPPPKTKKRSSRSSRSSAASKKEENI